MTEGLIGAPRSRELYDWACATAQHLTKLPGSFESGRLNRSLIKQLGENGLLARLFPRSVGGFHAAEVSAHDLCVIREALATHSTEAETAFALQGLGSYPILQSGGPQLVTDWLPRICRGDAVPAFALTEPDAGSDAAAIVLRAERTAGGYRLTGRKIWISNAPEADVYTMFARTEENAGSRGVTAFCVPGHSPGLRGWALDLMSPHPIGELELDGVFVPESHVLGTVNAGFKVAMKTLDLFRPSVGAFAVGMAQRALELALEHAENRHAFGGPLRNLQAVGHKLADMATSTQAARLLVYDAAAAYDTGAANLSLRASMAKLFATEVAQRVVDDAIQIHGARALQRGHVLEHLYRDVRAPRIYEGASEVQRSIITTNLYRHGTTW